MNIAATTSTLSGTLAQKSRAPRWLRRDPLLAMAVLASLGLVVVASVGLLVDPRLITGAPAWAKPFKFAVSIAVYCATLAWRVGVVRRDAGK
jgi:hypothetical protein